MVQAFTGDSARNFAVEISTDNVTWKNIAGDAASVQPAGGDRAVGEAYVFSKDTAGVTQGKRAPIDLVVRCFYKEEATAAAVLVRGYYEAGTRVYFRYAPLDTGGLGHSWFSCDPDAVIRTFKYPGGEAASGDPVAIEFTVHTESLTESQKTS